MTDWDRIAQDLRNDPEGMIEMFETLKHTPTEDDHKYLKQEKPMIDRYFSKDLAVGIIYCLENHFSRISKLLDDAEIPRFKTGGDPVKDAFSVEQRVFVFVQAWQDIAGGSNMGRATLAYKAAEPTPDHKPMQPEEIDALIHGWCLACFERPCCCGVDHNDPS